MKMLKIRLNDADNVTFEVREDEQSVVISIPLHNAVDFATTIAEWERNDTVKISALSYFEVQHPGTAGAAGPEAATIERDVGPK